VPETRWARPSYAAIPPALHSAGLENTLSAARQDSLFDVHMYKADRTKRHPLAKRTEIKVLFLRSFADSNSRSKWRGQDNLGQK
jgi:hypothetical protein